MPLARGAYRHPHPGPLGRLLARLLNSSRLARARRAVLARLPFPVLSSDVADVVYLTWMVDAAAARKLLPPGLALWERGGLTPFTVLTYRHGHFGPALAGPLRRLFPSPLQSNWRLYLDGALPRAAPANAVYFVENMMDSAVYAAGTRLFSDIMQTHLPARFVHRHEADRFLTAILPGAGSAPSLACACAPVASGTLPPSFAGVFESWNDAVAMLACQDAALAWSARLGELVLAWIDLPVALDEVQPLAPAGRVECSALTGLAPRGEPLCFQVPRVPFAVLGERTVDLPTVSTPAAPA